jgi:hypothetical protein
MKTLSAIETTKIRWGLTPIDTKTYVFDPTCEIPDELAHILLRGNPDFKGKFSDVTVEPVAVVEAPKGFICEVCGQTFGKAVALSSHSRKHKEKPQ